MDGKQLSGAAQSALCGYDWPGNVRQLENICRRLTVMAPGQTVGIGDLPAELGIKADKVVPVKSNSWEHSLQSIASHKLMEHKSNILDELLPEFEAVLIRTALQHTNGHKQEAAKCLGWGRNTLTRKMKELSLD